MKSNICIFYAEYLVWIISVQYKPPSNRYFWHPNVLQIIFGILKDVTLHTAKYSKDAY